MRIQGPEKDVKQQKLIKMLMNFNLAKRLKQKVRPHIAMDNILKKGSRQGVSQGPVH